MRLRLWAAPIAVMTALMALLGTLYLAYVVNPEENLHGFPVLLVNSDEGDTVGGRYTNAGKLLTEGLLAGIPADKVDVEVVGLPEVDRELALGRSYGALIIPSDFSKRLSNLGIAGVVAGDVEKPIITVRTNPRAGSIANQIMLRIADQALAVANTSVGGQLTQQVQAQLGPKGPPLSGAARLALAAPVHTVVAPYNPLPDGSGEGLSAFFYTLLLLLAGFTGAMTVHTMTDSALGFIPTEYGPWYVHFPKTPHSRLQTLLVKWGIMTIAGFIVSAVYLVAGRLLGMPIERPVVLWLYGAFAIIAVGVTALSVLAALGTAGMLVNLIVFIVLGLPSCGGTVPIEAVPRYIGWLARFEPMHQVYLAIRGILYFGAHGEAGLLRGFWMTAFGLAVGLTIGAVITRYYDHKGLHRSPA
ncbi:MAG: DUF3533 domain-containing protein [Mycobacteriaceae bacterium]|nr:DUF3533 domain-containing protein [Mycobacteriaceae bacterium]